MIRLRSLRLRLLLAGVVGVMLAALVAGGLVGEAYQRYAQRALDQRLGDDIEGLVGLAEIEPNGDLVMRREPADERYARVFSGWYWQVGTGTQRRQSRSLWDAALAPDLATDGTRRFALLDGPQGQRLRVLSQAVRLPGAVRSLDFVVAGDQAELEAEAHEFRLFAAGAMALIAAALLTALAWQVGWGLHPLRRMGATLHRIRHDGEARFDLTGMPSEIVPLAAQINQLLDEHEQRIQRARRTAQDLAHALKTPLAVLDAERQRPGPQLPALVGEQVQRMRVTVERQLSGLGTDVRRRTPLRPTAEALRDLLLRAHSERELRIDLELPSELVFAGAGEDLEEMLGNLLDNACKWACTRIVLRAAQQDAELCIAVEDDGPGLAPEAHAQALQRGGRLDERAPGSGLGLAIAGDVAAAYGGGLTLERAALGGLSAVLRLPAASGLAGGGGRDLA